MAAIDPCENEGRTLLADALDSIHDGIAILDLDFDFEWANKWMEARYSEHMPLVGKKCYQVLKGVEEPCAECPLREALETGETVSHIIPFLSEQGATGWLDVSISPLADGGVKAVRGVAHFRDVTEHMQAEEALRDEISRRRILVEESRDGIVLMDVEGRVVESNLQFAHMLGYSMEEMHSLAVWDWEAELTEEEVRVLFATVDTAGQHFLTRHRRKDGTFYEVEISSNGATFGGRKYVLAVCRDISEAKQAEREREALIKELQEALTEIKALRGILPLCSYCNKVRDDEGYWEQVDVYISKHSHADVSHGICPDCAKRFFPELRAREE